jgi:hypothetical protein
VLVTDKNGNQTVQTIKDELGMKVKNMGDIKRRLGSQGVDTNHVEMYGQAGNKMDKPSISVSKSRTIDAFHRLFLVVISVYCSTFCLVLLFLLP